MSAVHSCKSESLENKYQLNQVDTPGHADFSYEVLRSLKACETTLLLVDAAQGIQAQTLAHFRTAKSLGNKIIPIINKCDLPSADPDSVELQIGMVFGLEEEPLRISAKTGQGISSVIDTIIDKALSPSVPKVNNQEGQPIEDDNSKHLRGFIFDSWFESNKGVYLLVRIYNGRIKIGDQVKLSSDPTNKLEVHELGILLPEKYPRNILETGEVGYVFLNMKNSEDAIKNLGMTVSFYQDYIEDLPGLPKNKPLVYTSLYPDNPDLIEQMTSAVSKQVLEDPGIDIVRETSGALGTGFRCGFLGLLHMDVFRQRLAYEFQIETITTFPNVVYRVKCQQTDEIKKVENFADCPEYVKEWYEPWVKASIIINNEFEGPVTGLSEERRGKLQTRKELNDDQLLLVWEFPLNEIITDFHDQLKSKTKGYVSWEFELIDYRIGKIKKLIIHVAGEPVDSLSFLVHENAAFDLGKKLCKKLHKLIPKQLFTVSVQARVGGRSIASEKIEARRKDVTAKCYGGDYSRKKKLLEKQKEGKKKMKELGKVSIDMSSFNKIFKDIN